MSDDVWGVIDGFIETDFPDIRIKTTIQSEHGTCKVIPREGDLVRIYLQISSVNSGLTQMTEIQLMELAKLIFKPYTLYFSSIQWWSIYVIGRRCASRFMDDEGLIFIAGDACHTHSPKAGQGMNAAIADAHNLAWKLALVIKGLANKKILETYEIERRHFAEQLINFDRQFVKLLSDRHGHENQEEPQTNELFLNSILMYNNFVNGFDIVYPPSLITRMNTSCVSLARGVRVGGIFMSQIVVRHVDGRPFHIHDLMPINLCFRILIFAGDCTHPSKLQELQDVAIELKQFSERYTPNHGFCDYLFDFITITSNRRSDFERETLPVFLCQNKWKIFCDEVASDGVRRESINKRKVQMLIL